MKTGTLGRAGYQLSNQAGKYEARATAVWVTDRGEEACECVRYYRHQIVAVGRIHAEAARLRTETS